MIVTRSWEYREDAGDPLSSSPVLCYLHFVGFLDNSCFDLVEGKVGSGFYNNLPLGSLQDPRSWFLPSSRAGNPGSLTP